MKDIRGVRNVQIVGNELVTHENRARLREDPFTDCRILDSVCRREHQIVCRPLVNEGG